VCVCWGVGGAGVHLFGRCAGVYTRAKRSPEVWSMMFPVSGKKRTSHMVPVVRSSLSTSLRMARHCSELHFWRLRLSSSHVKRSTPVLRCFSTLRTEVEKLARFSSSMAAPTQTLRLRDTPRHCFHCATSSTRPFVREIGSCSTTEFTRIYVL